MLGTYSLQRGATAARLLILLSLAISGICQNIDTATPILREPSTQLDDNAYFGYSLVLHQTNTNPTNRAEALEGTRIVVSAPKGTAAGGVPVTGVVYSCPINSGPCTTLPGKLFDTSPNANNENKTGQFLGASMDSDNGRFIVCAHRWTELFTNLDRTITFPFPLGKCFYTNGGTLSNFQEYQPCSTQNGGRLRLESISVCQAGASSVIAPDGVFGIGATGFNFWRGVIFRRAANGNTNRQSGLSGIDRFSYQGYSITSGHFLSRTEEDFATSLPRSGRYFGTVNIVTNNANLQVVSQPLRGLQMGEYYGFSLLAADLNGDGFDELLVGAPLFRANSTEPETGRVFVYRNTDGGMQISRIIEGRIRYGRFGYAMANLGDINGDNIDDVAISAPFGEARSDEPGTVYIYHSTPPSSQLLLSNEPQQIIRGTDLVLTQGLASLRGFGTSLASGVDVDMNEYNDLLVGSFLSQQAFLLRARPLATVTASIMSAPPIVDVMATSNPDCMLNGTAYACFVVMACATYRGRGLMNNLALTVTVSADTQNVERRIVFADNRTTAMRTINSALNQPPVCANITAYVRSPINDIFNPFVIDMAVQAPQRTVTPGDGNQAPADLSAFPEVSVTGNMQVQVETLKQCGDQECVPDLRISVIQRRIIATDGSSLTSIVAGFTSSVEYFLDVTNRGEDAFQARLVFDLPTSVLELVNIFNQTGNGEVSLSCNDPPEILTNGFTRHDCSIGNPFTGDRSINLRVLLNPLSGVVGNEADINFNFSVSSINPEEPPRIADGSNFALATLSIEARADVTIDDGVVMPQLISYSDNTQLSNGDPLANVTQLGPAVDVSFLVRNSGPSRVQTILLDISWPLNGTLTAGNFYLYITSIQATGGGSVTCNPAYINPLSLQGDVSGDQEGVDPTVSMGTGRRKKRSTMKRVLSKRQEVMQPEEELSENVTLSCASQNPILNCVNIRCTVLGLAGSTSTQIDINSRLDERFFSTNNDRYVFIATASVSVQADFIQSSVGEAERSASAQIRVIPAARVPSAGPVEATRIEWWVIVVPIIAGIIIIAVVTTILWVCGFFRRKKHEEIKQQREELQNLNDNGVTPGDVSEEVPKL